MVLFPRWIYFSCNVVLCNNTVLLQLLSKRSKRAGRTRCFGNSCTDMYGCCDNCSCCNIVVAPEFKTLHHLVVLQFLVDVIVHNGLHLGLLWQKSEQHGEVHKSHLSVELCIVGVLQYVGPLSSGVGELGRIRSMCLVKNVLYIIEQFSHLEAI